MNRDEFIRLTKDEKCSCDIKWALYSDCFGIIRCQNCGKKVNPVRAKLWQFLKWLEAKGLLKEKGGKDEKQNSKIG